MAALNVGAMEDQVAVSDAARFKAAARFNSFTPEELLNAILSYVGQSQQKSEPWLDKYSPRKLLIQCGFESLLGWQSVSAVGANEDGKASDMLIWVSNGASVAIITVEEGATKLKQLRESLWGIYGTPCRNGGGWHWGAHEDACVLAGVLSIGFCVFSTEQFELQHPRSRSCSSANCNTALVCF